MVGELSNSLVHTEATRPKTPGLNVDGEIGGLRKGQQRAPRSLMNEWLESARDPVRLIGFHILSFAFRDFVPPLREGALKADSWGYFESVPGSLMLSLHYSFQKKTESRKETMEPGSNLGSLNWLMALEEENKSPEGESRHPWVCERKPGSSRMLPPIVKVPLDLLYPPWPGGLPPQELEAGLVADPTQMDTDGADVAPELKVFKPRDKALGKCIDLHVPGLFVTPPFELILALQPMENSDDPTVPQERPCSPAALSSMLVGNFWFSVYEQPTFSFQVPPGMQAVRIKQKEEEGEGQRGVEEDAFDQGVPSIVFRVPAPPTQSLESFAASKGLHILMPLDIPHKRVALCVAVEMRWRGPEDGHFKGLSLSPPEKYQQGTPQRKAARGAYEGPARPTHSPVKKFRSPSSSAETHAVEVLHSNNERRLRWQLREQKRLELRERVLSTGKNSLRTLPKMRWGVLDTPRATITNILKDLLIEEKLVEQRHRQARALARDYNSPPPLWKVWQKAIEGSLMETLCSFSSPTESKEDDKESKKNRRVGGARKVQAFAQASRVEMARELTDLHLMGASSMSVFEDLDRSKGSPSAAAERVCHLVEQSPVMNKFRNDMRSEWWTDKTPKERLQVAIEKLYRREDLNAVNKRLGRSPAYKKTVVDTGADEEEEESESDGYETDSEDKDEHILQNTGGTYDDDESAALSPEITLPTPNRPAFVPLFDFREAERIAHKERSVRRESEFLSVRRQ
uniref:Uncharacterized protein n=1 Tax=Chromera velia CCMP2878 TaxID=1169474 RepID=A0A0G4H4E4_9ALVE|eukprot:Cvel_24592.t1-p1 / transcript=Cvel_24592.t1 / gene=Cvel_24592 / organism=Chromera_velia_CCMP2878 / gene_product=hypothetical protein / transcript_product=hypothetical protein / location=Cvel_scaffold2678:1756-6083(-) / protein_length=741 / sequence_SO=supercontig / SO=protein_coding / is_pseudo=false